jgi:lipopolysaccharide biosynthesis glycosyltransferase
MTKKTNLIYYTIGGSPDYVRLLVTSIESVVHFCDMSDTHILLICEQQYYQYVKDLPYIHDIMVLEDTQDSTKSQMALSVRRLRIFEYPFIFSYQRLFYIDCDTICTGNITADIMPHIKKPNALYVLPEYFSPDKIHHHKDYFFSLPKMPYSDTDLAIFKENQQYPFNSGQFMCVINQTMKRHFTKLCTFIQSYTLGSYFHDQAMMNYYFNKHLITVPTLHTFFMLYKGQKTMLSHTYLIHFITLPITKNDEEKLQRMKTFFAFMKSRPPPTLPTPLSLPSSSSVDISSLAQHTATVSCSDSATDVTPPSIVSQSVNETH